MAEQALYENQDEPEFPYQVIAPRLLWVADYIEALTFKRGRNGAQSHAYSVLINTLLVFSRARTAALFSNSDLPVCQPFLNRLKLTLRSLPPKIGAGHHQIEIVVRDNHSFFITCSRSPRFIWKQILTHRETGLNLDYAAAGHLGQRDSKGVAIMEISGQTSLRQIIAEKISLDYVSDMASVEDFIRRRTSLFNSTMSQLNLPYRFDCFWTDANTDDDVFKVMQSKKPPSSEWWMKNYPFISNLPYSMVICSADTLFEKYWQIIQAIYKFDQSQHPLFKHPIPVEYSIDVEDLYKTLYMAMNPRYNSQGTSFQNLKVDLASPGDLLDWVTTVINDLAIDLDKLRLEGTSPTDRNKRKSDLSCQFQRVWETCKIYTVERWKLRTPLYHPVVQEWPQYGNNQSAVDPPGRKRLSLRMRDFWRDRYI